MKCLGLYTILLYRLLILILKINNFKIHYSCYLIIMYYYYIITLIIIIIMYSDTYEYIFNVIKSLVWLLIFALGI